MHWVDIIIVIILAVGLGKGLANGFVRGIFGIAALVLGIVIAAANYQEVVNTLFSRLQIGADARAILGFLLVFVVVLILVSVVGRIISKALKLASLRWMDRLAGGVLGLVMASLFTGVLLLIVGMAGLQANAGVARSVVAPMVIHVTDTIVVFAPDVAREMVEEHYVKLRREWEKARREGRSKDEESEEEPSVTLIDVAAPARAGWPAVGFAVVESIEVTARAA